MIQLLPSHHLNDAIGDEARVIERLLRASGWQVDSYAEYIDEELQESTRTLDQLKGAKEKADAALYHFCLHSPATDYFTELKCPKVLIYHNVTPPEYFEPFDKGFAGVCKESLTQLRRLADHVDVGLGDSELNRRDLEAMGYKRTRVLPYLFDPEKYAVEPDEAMLEKLGTDPLVLFVGRMAPNKAQDDFMRVAAEYADAGYPPARFILAGKRNAIPLYWKILEKLHTKLNLNEEQLLITGAVSQAELVALYRKATIFLSMSKHEGFMVPLLECMLFGVPIMSRASGAIPETLGDAGILFETGAPKSVAKRVVGLLGDDRLKRILTDKGRKRLERYDLSRWKFVLDTVLRELK